MDVGKENKTENENQPLPSKKNVWKTTEQQWAMLNNKVEESFTIYSTLIEKYVDKNVEWLL